MIATLRGLTLLLALTPLFAADWPMYLYDISHSSFNPAESQIDKQSAPFLDAAWVTNLSAPMAAAPTISGRVAYVGTWDGSFYAIDTETGAVLWSAFVGMAADPAKAECMAAIGVTSQAVVVGNRVYVGGGDSAVYAFDKKTGSQIWRTSLADPQSGAYLWSSVTYYNGALYIGVASLGDCPLVRGALVRIDLARPDRPLFRWLAQEDDVGGGVWSTPAIDVKMNAVYVTTGTGEQGSANGTWGGAMLALDATTLEIRSYFFLPTNSVELDIEWGSSPTLFETSYGFPLIAATGKDGVLYAQRRDSLFPVWSTQVAIECICPECGCGSISTPAFDGQHAVSRGRRRARRNGPRIGLRHQPGQRRNPVESRGPGSGHRAGDNRQWGALRVHRKGAADLRRLGRYATLERRPGSYDLQPAGRRWRRRVLHTIRRQLYQVEAGVARCGLRRPPSMAASRLQPALLFH